ncbi:MAG TPA: NusG domain II-containing protein, partial [Bacilli bacterium]|nr:NusG domain II-containing protein [Bacilli bacterium]
MKAPKVKINKTPWDTYTFSALLVLASLLLVILNSAFKTSDPLMVFVYVENALIDKLDLKVEQSKTYLQSEYPSFKGDITIEILNEKVRVEKETSPLKYCSIQGYVGEVARPVICLPNAFY